MLERIEPSIHILSSNKGPKNAVIDGFLPFSLREGSENEISTIYFFEEFDLKQSQNGLYEVHNSFLQIMSNLFAKLKFKPKSVVQKPRGCKVFAWKVNKIP